MSDGVTVTFVEESGAEKVLTGLTAGQSLMEAGRAAGIEGILADCGGGCACATCHVYVAEEWRERVGPPDEVELEMLDMTGDLMRPESRLSCQVRLTDALDGLRVQVAAPY